MHAHKHMWPTWAGVGSHRRPPRRAGASGGAPAGSARPAQSHWRLWSAAGSPCGRTPAPEAVGGDDVITTVMSLRQWWHYVRDVNTNTPFNGNTSFQSSWDSCLVRRYGNGTNEALQVQTYLSKYNVTYNISKGIHCSSFNFFFANDQFKEKRSIWHRTRCAMSVQMIPRVLPSRRAWNCQSRR